MSALTFAWTTLVRQPARAVLGVLGIAAVGALLFDMLLLSNGLLLSMRSLLDQYGFDVRVTASPALPGLGPRIAGATAIAERIKTLPSVDEAVPLRFGTAEIAAQDGRPPLFVSVVGADRSQRRSWTMVSGRDLQASANEPEIVINDALAAAIGSHSAEGGLTHITLRASCRTAPTAAPPVTFRVVGVGRFPFDTVNQLTAGTTRLDLVHACGEDDRDQADLIVVASAPGHEPDDVRAAIGRLDPALTAVTNEQMVGQLDASGFSYFRQISAVLATITSAFGLLLITVLLTVSVNQRLGTIAALRAIGLTRSRVIADVVCESALMVGAGGVLAVPLGFLLAEWLDRILTRIPGLPGDLHFFVFEPRALAVHAGILVATAVLAAAYPARLVARLPIAATLRDETIS
jgi:putative ABC transport system permease protein